MVDSALITSTWQPGRREIFLETLDWTEVTTHTEIAGISTLKNAISVGQQLEGIQEQSRAGWAEHLRALKLDDSESEGLVMLKNACYEEV